LALQRASKGSGATPSSCAKRNSPQNEGRGRASFARRSAATLIADCGAFGIGLDELVATPFWGVQNRNISLRRPWFQPLLKAIGDAPQGNRLKIRVTNGRRAESVVIL
jgi:hypothetical protein